MGFRGLNIRMITEADLAKQGKPAKQNKPVVSSIVMELTPPSLSDIKTEPETKSEPKPEPKPEPELVQTPVVDVVQAVLEDTTEKSKRSSKSKRS